MINETEKYEYIRALIDGEDLTMEHKTEGNPVKGRTDHDEDVSDWSEEDVRDLIVALLGVSEEQRGIIDIQWA